MTESNGTMDQDGPKAYDLTTTIGQYLDRHMVLPMLNFVEDNPYLRKVYDLKQVQQAKYDLLQDTNMLDSAIEYYQQTHDGEAVPPQLEESREKVILSMRYLEEQAGPLLKVVHDDELMQKLLENDNFNMENLGENFGVSDDVLDFFYEYSRFQFDVGFYSDAGTYLKFYHMLRSGANPTVEYFALWGKLASNILSGEYVEAEKDLGKIKDAVDSNGRLVALNPLQLLQNRTWLIHWSLFVYLHGQKNYTALMELLMSEKYLGTIQTNCPHILRYLTAAVIINKRRRNMIKDLVKVIQQESYSYSDPVTDFIQCLYVDFDFEGAQSLLQKCENTIKSDFFLHGCLEEFMENARITIFEIYCRIHQVINIDMLSEKLNMDRDSAEKWVVNLIREARLDAKIDSQANQVIMGLNVPSIYEQIVEGTKNLLDRSAQLAQNFDRTQGFTPGMDFQSSASDDKRRRGGRSGGREGMRGAR